MASLFSDLWKLLSRSQKVKGDSLIKHFQGGGPFSLQSSCTTVTNILNKHTSDILFISIKSILLGSKLSC